MVILSDKDTGYVWNLGLWSNCSLIGEDVTILLFPDNIPSLLVLDKWFFGGKVTSLYFKIK